MTVAVTGASGFVGVNLVRKLVAEGHAVRALDVTASPHLPPGVEFVRTDVLDPRSIAAGLAGADTVYHLVAKITLSERDELAWRLNTEGARNAAEAALAAGVRRYVHCSSIHAFDQYRSKLIDESSVRSENPAMPVYDRSKWAGEQEVQAVVRAGLDAVICNPTGVLGPIDHGPSRVNGMLLDAAKGRVPAVLQGGFDFVDVRDVAEGLVAAAEKGNTGENYLLAGEFIPVLDMFRMAAAAAGRRGPRIAFPLGMIKPVLPIAERIGNRFGSDLVSAAAIGALETSPRIDRTKAARELGYQPRPMQETISDLVAFFVTSGMLSRAR
ncbi:NAD-dependent epimerase/dehydratase family protein [Antrihabitans sp. YC2-6]|uniref:NAD-dependent epimerase/dehydratase family protein n=1 Tax=Antrihabitans sp. YC2-6 TaxID=2799498 RepID=UPI0018F3C46F|nr:NAD-dependent epimerase/dehydratase family protein [Antrihabitans sp. YC2-6]MBJ8346790.1 NAD-dependent epimerase/dehydratase family protein [Antrihabitans sp. YC2-6]